LLKKPNTPILVNTIRITTALHRYTLYCISARSQYLCNHSVVTILPNSRLPPSTTIGQNAAAKMAVRPSMEYTAADIDNIKAVNKVKYPNIID